MREYFRKFRNNSGGFALPLGFYIVHIKVSVFLNIVKYVERNKIVKRISTKKI
jgi:hypothetical protein